MSKPQIHCHVCRKPISNDEPLASIVPLTTPDGKTAYAHARHRGVVEEYQRQGHPGPVSEEEDNEEVSDDHSD